MSHATHASPHSDASGDDGVAAVALQHSVATPGTVAEGVAYAPLKGGGGDATLESSDGPSTQPDGERGSCRSCGATVFWIVTRNDKRMPLDPDGVSHFATCPQAASWRKR